MRPIVGSAAGRQDHLFLLSKCGWFLSHASQLLLLSKRGASASCLCLLGQREWLPGMRKDREAGRPLPLPGEPFYLPRAPQGSCHLEFLTGCLSVCLLTDTNTHRGRGGVISKGNVKKSALPFSQEKDSLLHREECLCPANRKVPLPPPQLGSGGGGGEPPWS